MKYFILFVLIGRIGFAATERVSKSGYLFEERKGLIYFLVQPGTLESAPKIEFSSRGRLREACILKEFTMPVSCPIQTFSFIPNRVKNRVVLTHAKLENPNTAWHRLRRKEILLDIPDPESQIK